LQLAKATKSVVIGPLGRRWTTTSSKFSAPQTKWQKWRKDGGLGSPKESSHRLTEELAYEGTLEGEIHFLHLTRSLEGCWGDASTERSEKATGPRTPEGMRKASRNA